MVISIKQYLNEIMKMLRNTKTELKKALLMKKKGCVKPSDTNTHMCVSGGQYC